MIHSLEGPKIKISQTELEFGQIKVLKDYSLKLTLKNDSDIEADFHAFTKDKNSIFQPVQQQGIIKPKEKCQIQVVCNADDAVKFSDVLNIVIKESQDIEVQLNAKGVGSTIFCQEDLSQVNLGVIYSHKKVFKKIFVENRGRQPQKLEWIQQLSVQEYEDPQNSNPEDEAVFTISPAWVELPPKNGIIFQFSGLSRKLGQIQENFMLYTTVGNSEKVDLLYFTMIEGVFIQPTLQFSDRKLFFKYFWEKNVPLVPISRNLGIECTYPLPVNFGLKCQPPFSINQEMLQLLPGESATVRIEFDPVVTDRISGQYQGKLQLSHNYNQHPLRDSLDLISEVNFPNLILETNLMNFGSIPYDSTKKMLMTIKNQSEMALNYEWNFVSEEFSESGQKLKIQIYEIQPQRGHLEAGSDQVVEFVYNAIGGQILKTTAVCHVEGGPDYEVTLLSGQVEQAVKQQLLNHQGE